MKDLLIATGNANKVREYREMLEPLGYRIRSLKDFDAIEIDENGSSFEENALIKARALFDHTGITCIADDSGLEIDALNGQPGIHSARWMGEDTPYTEKNAAILKRMEQEKNRKARFVCVIAVVFKDGEKLFRGDFDGEIAFEQRGENGFGYDPIFYVKEAEKTSAEMLPEEKNAISHRGKATAQLLAYLRKEAQDV